jgi:hypothetical protein
MVCHSRASSFLLLVARRWHVLLLVLLVSLISVIELSLRLILLWHWLILSLLSRVKVSALVGGGSGHWDTAEILLGAHTCQLFDLDTIYEGLLLRLGEGVVAGSLNVLSLFFF